jgi:L-arabinose isomerase
MNSLEDYTDGERDVDGREVWFPTGGQELYGEETLRQVAAQSAKVTATLDAASSVPVRITRNRR